jgi:hypothetical protein
MSDGQPGQAFFFKVAKTRCRCNLVVGYAIHPAIAFALAFASRQSIENVSRTYYK